MKLGLPNPGDQVGAVWYATAASSRYPEHYHDLLELNLVLRGTAAYRVEGEGFPLRAGSLVALPPGTPHRLENVSWDFTAWVIEATADFVARTNEHRLLSGKVRGGAADRAGIARLSKACAPLLQPCSPPATGVAMERILAEAGPWVGFLERRSVPVDLCPAVARAADLLGGLDDPDLAAVARKVGLSASRLTHLFTEQLGLPPVQYRNHLRVQRFIARFARGDGQNMLATALETGFGSYPQFHRVFRQVAGYSPAEHLRRVRAGIVDPVPQGPVLVGPWYSQRPSTPRIVNNSNQERLGARSRQWY